MGAVADPAIQQFGALMRAARADGLAFDLAWAGSMRAMRRPYAAGSAYDLTLTRDALAGTRGAWRRAWDGGSAVLGEGAVVELFDAIEEGIPGEAGILVA
ncbi:MAG: hypothetical protein ACSLFR_08665 [Solirubrobacteraceae bacterium]